MDDQAEASSLELVRPKLGPAQRVVGIFLYPRQTIRGLLDSGTSIYTALALALAAGVVQGLDSGLSKHLGDDEPLGDALRSGALLGLMVGIPGTYLMAWLYHTIGRSLGGRSTFPEVIRAVCWTRIPALCQMVPIAVMIGLASAGWVEPILFICALVIEMVLAVWGLVSTIRGCAEAHRFSSWRSLLAFFLAGLVVVLIVVVAFVALMGIGMLMGT